MKTKRTKVKFNVTQGDIEKGKPNDSMWCPIGLCGKRTLEQCVQVGVREIEINHHIYDLPKKAGKFIEDFDEQRPVKPFSFVLRLEPE